MPEEHRLRGPELPSIPKAPVKPIETSTPLPEASQKLEVPDRPHSATYFEVPAWGELITNPSLDTFALKDKSVFIDSYLSKKLVANGMKKDAESFGHLLGEIEQYLHLDKKTHEPVYRITKVFNMLKTIEHANQVNEDRRKYLESILSKV